MSSKKISFLLLVPLFAILYISWQDDTLAESVKRGKEIYTLNCQSCHLENGEGVEGLYPPLAKSDYLLKDPKRSVGIILNGQNEEITVNGKKYNVLMPAQAYLSDQQIADVINYTTQSFGNKSKTVITPEMVEKERK